MVERRSRPARPSIRRGAPSRAPVRPAARSTGRTAMMGPMMSRRQFLRTAGVGAAALGAAAAGLGGVVSATGGPNPDPAHIEDLGSAGFRITPTGNDDTENIRWALNNNPAGGTVAFEEGTYNVSKAIFVYNFDGFVQGAGKNNTTIISKDLPLLTPEEAEIYNGIDIPSAFIFHEKVINGQSWPTKLSISNLTFQIEGSPKDEFGNPVFWTALSAYGTQVMQSIFAMVTVHGKKPNWEYTLSPYGFPVFATDADREISHANVDFNNVAFLGQEIGAPGGPACLKCNAYMGFYFVGARDRYAETLNIPPFGDIRAMSLAYVDKPMSGEVNITNCEFKDIVRIGCEIATLVSTPLHGGLTGINWIQPGEPFESKINVASSYFENVGSCGSEGPFCVFAWDPSGVDILVRDNEFVDCEGFNIGVLPGWQTVLGLAGPNLWYPLSDLNKVLINGNAITRSAAVPPAPPVFYDCIFVSSMGVWAPILNYWLPYAFFTPKKDIDATIVNNRIDSVTQMSMGMRVDGPGDSIVTRNTVSGAGLAGIAVGFLTEDFMRGIMAMFGFPQEAINGYVEELMPGDSNNNMLMRNNLSGFSPYGVPIWLGTAASNCTVMGRPGDFLYVYDQGTDNKIIDAGAKAPGLSQAELAAAKEEKIKIMKGLVH